MCVCERAGVCVRNMQVCMCVKWAGVCVRNMQVCMCVKWAGVCVCEWAEVSAYVCVCVRNEQGCVCVCVNGQVCGQVCV